MADIKANTGDMGIATLKRIFKSIYAVAMDLLFPAFCLGCGKETTFLCDECLAVMPLQKEQVCPYCYATSAGGAICAECGDQPLDAVVSASVYADKTLMAAAIHSLKYDFVRDLADPLAQILVNLRREHGGFEDFVICPVPLHKKRLHWRGFNQSALLAKTVALHTGHKVVHLLERVSFSAPQMELSKEAREINVHGAFRCTVLAPPPKILLVDDVATTLSTLDECAKALKEAGAKEVKAIVLARAY